MLPDVSSPLSSPSRQGGERAGVRGFLRRAGPFAVVALLCLVLYAPGLASIPTLDRDEARFVQASRQMLETGDFIRIRFQNHARDKKPAGIYWLQAASVALFSTPASDAMWSYRLPSAVGAAIAALLTLGLGRALFPQARQAGFFAGIIMASTLGLIAEAHIAKTDAVLCAAVVAGQAALGLAYLRARAGMRVGWPLAIGFWIAEAAGILLKGPVMPMIALLTVASLAIADLDLHIFTGLRPLAGLCILAGLVLPWLVAIELTTAGRFLTHAVGHDLLPKLLGGQDAHGAPPGTYLALLPLTFWPGSLLAVPALLWGWRQRRAPAERFLLAWLVPAWLIFELVPTKLPNYVLPLYPALALLAGRALDSGRLAPTQFAGEAPAVRWARIADYLVRGVWSLVTLALAAALVVLPLVFGHGLAPAGIVGAAALLVLAALLLPRRPPAATALLLAGLAAAFVLPAAAVLPGLDRLWLSRAAAALVARHPPPPGEPLVAVGYSEPSLVFMLGTKTRLATVPVAAQVLAKGGAALVSRQQEASFRRVLAARGLVLHAEGHVAGLDYSTGHTLVLTLYDVAPG
jgi:4-amino-4-deoxy-L-arabinose transferase-like glycosyltransferase